jgi:hypothetical protein
MLEFNAGIIGGELPIGLGVVFVAVSPGSDCDRELCGDLGIYLLNALAGKTSEGFVARRHQREGQQLEQIYCQMALKPCPECKAQISATADACPQCGYSFRKQNRDRARLGCLFLVGLFALLGALSIGERGAE